MIYSYRNRGGGLRHSPIFIAQDLLQNRYEGALGLFVAGSVVRGEASQYSDLDLVVIYPSVDHAYRESFMFREWPVEANIHDPETLRYFLEVVHPACGRPELHQMMIEGLAFGDGKALELTRNLAQESFNRGPTELSEDEITQRRYQIQELTEDLKAPRGRSELIAAASLLYHELGDYYFRSQNLWSARGKAIPRHLKRTDIEYYQEFSEAFDGLFTHGEIDRVVQLTEKTLHGALAFDGLTVDSPSSWRLKVQEKVISP
jgi:hypothetical protein